MGPIWAPYEHDGRDASGPSGGSLRFPPPLRFSLWYQLPFVRADLGFPASAVCQKTLKETTSHTSARFISSKASTNDTGNFNKIPPNVSTVLRFYRTSSLFLIIVSASPDSVCMLECPSSVCPPPVGTSFYTTYRGHIQR